MIILFTQTQVSQLNLQEQLCYQWNFTSMYDYLHNNYICGPRFRDILFFLKGQYMTLAIYAINVGFYLNVRFIVDPLI